MEKLSVRCLGPIETCDIQISDTMIFMGEQASGKSTIAKSIFFFKNIPNLLIALLNKSQMLNSGIEIPLKNRLIKATRLNFLQTFGSTWGMDNNMCLSFSYTDEVEITVSLTEDETNPNYIWIHCSQKLSDFLKKIEERITRGSDSDEIKNDIKSFFGDYAEIIYIPAGRSMITLLSNQLSYLYASMDDLQKREMDYCTQNYLEEILRRKSFFSRDLQSIVDEMRSISEIKINRHFLNLAIGQIQNILHGQYLNVNGEERVQLERGRYVKINFASSGQQEAVWILNLLFYYLVYNKKAFFIIEEPESHLYPNTQKQMMEYISLAKADQNRILVTTHSPYILGTANNLLFADMISGNADQNRLNEIIPRECWIKNDTFQAYYMRQGELEDCVDHDGGQIKNELIDGASCVINEDYDKMLELSYRRK